MWMNDDSSYLQERVIVIISRVLSFASRKVRGHVSHGGQSCHMFLNAESLQCFFPSLELESSKCLLGMSRHTGWDIEKRVNILLDFMSTRAESLNQLIKTVYAFRKQYEGVKTRGLLALWILTMNICNLTNPSIPTFLLISPFPKIFLNHYLFTLN